MLVNELFGAALLDALKIATPGTALISIEESCIDSSSEIAGQGWGIKSGTHFGSRYPGEPGVMHVYDILPDQLLPYLQNRQDFFGLLAFDKWTSSADARQAVFHRVNSPASPSMWVSLAIGNRSVFQGTDWTFRDDPRQGLYARQTVYGPTPTISDFEPWLDTINSVRKELFDETLERMPREWFEGDERAFLDLTRRLYQRRSKVPSLLRETLGYMFSGDSQTNLSPYQRRDKSTALSPVLWSKETSHRRGCSLNSTVVRQTD